MTAAGMLPFRVRVERRAFAGDDGYGNVIREWIPYATRWAGFRPEFGREAMAAGRLESTVRGVVTMRRCTTTAGITAADRLIFLTGPYADQTAQIRSAMSTPDGSDIEMTIEIGTAT